MALIKLGNAVQDARGTLNGSVFSRNKGGAYMRTKVSPVQPRTPAQLAVRANFSANAKLWSGAMSAAQRAAWVAYAVTYPYSNVFGDSSVLTGLAMSMAKNQVLLQIGAAPIEDPPADNSVDPIPVPSNLDANSSVPSLELTTTAQSALADTKYYIFATPSLPVGITPNESRYRFVGAYAPAAAATTLSIIDKWAAIFGALTQNQNVWAVVAQVSITKGNITVGQKLMAGIA
jgi:hypothetical protein